MNKINYLLQSRFDAIKKRAAEYQKFNPSGSYDYALKWQVKYGRKGWIQYDAPNHYNGGNLAVSNLDSFDAVLIQDISRRAFDYTGYYADNFQFDLIKPYIVKIKTSRGLLIAPAIAYDNCDVATIYLSDGRYCSADENSQDYYDITIQAARWADHYAEKLAEDGREYCAKDQAEQEAEQLRDDNKNALKEVKTLIQGIRDQRDIGQIVAPICNALMAEIKSLRQSIHANNERIAALKNDYWIAVR
jgi:hypothetical protein